MLLLQFRQILLHHRGVARVGVLEIFAQLRYLFFVLSLGLVLSLASLFRKAPELEGSTGSDRLFQAGWFQAVLVVTALATLVVVSLPYILTWLHR